MERCNAKDIGEFINIGIGDDLSIAELANMVKSTVSFEGRLVYDTSKPDGTLRKLLDITRIRALKWNAQTSLRIGIKKTYEDYLSSISK